MVAVVDLDGAIRKLAGLQRVRRREVAQALLRCLVVLQRRDHVTHGGAGGDLHPGHMRKNVADLGFRHALRADGAVRAGDLADRQADGLIVCYADI